MQRSRRIQGFTLLEMAVVLLIIALIVGGAVASLALVLERQRVADSQDRLDLIQKALLDYSTAKGYLPCPADITTAETTAPFGIGTGSGVANPAACVPPACIPGCAAANFNDGGNTYAGMIPTKSLGLPDEAAIDGWGMRIFYAVDQRLTVPGALNYYLQAPTVANPATAGSIQVNDDAGGTRTTTGAYILLSFGQDGHGAWPAQGGAARRSVNNNDGNTKQNCHCDQNANPTAFDNKLVQQWTTSSNITGASTFDDMLRFARRSDFRPAASEMPGR